MPEPLTPDESAALAMLPFAKRTMDSLRELLPPGTHFGVFVLVPGQPDGRVLALCTDRDRVGPAVAQWYLSTAGQGR